jgi:hypothetical protein
MDRHRVAHRWYYAELLTLCLSRPRLYTGRASAILPRARAGQFLQLAERCAAQPHWQGKFTPRDYAALTPLIWEHGKRGTQSQIRQADIVNSKRFGSVLTMAREAQLASNERRSKSCPSRLFPTAAACSEVLS